jgi:hypothetical protein
MGIEWRFGTQEGVEARLKGRIDRRFEKLLAGGEAGYGELPRQCD